jgi:hypothetical protein
MISKKPLIFGIKALILLASTQLVGCQTIPEATSENTVTKKEIKLPKSGEIKTIKQGDSIYTHLEYTGSFIYKPTEVKKYTVPRFAGIGNYKVEFSPANFFIKGKTKEGWQIICSIEKVASNHIDKLSICISDEKTPGKLTKLIVNQSDMYTKDLILDVPPQFTETEVAFNPSGPTKREIIFESLEKKNLVLRYREYADDKLISNQPLVIAMDTLPAVIDVRQAVLKINSYSNGVLEYSVQKEMPSLISGDEKVLCVTPGFNFISTNTLRSCLVRKMTAFPLGFYNTPF